MNFYIDPEFLVSVTIKEEWDTFKGKEYLTDDELIKLSKGYNISSSIHSEDHPEFAKLRNQLGEEGYIKIERGWSNGDRVLKPFVLNGKNFAIGQQFSCAPALRYDLVEGNK